eukprot:CAMPEP_0113965670 /NCGR_PEP_ID=MMETSP0011_2-20120614/7879_1 /TAXON_ID=101924 /ORGANISM="Rhodosorus marinus" /LENGTH=366 /DNA_ID=CAMNT_0000978219 /DNA_START=395 /DNA_END=1495 /DNA_ORIENTATION=- /assembly_acc=CAM_ASM_000156
MVVSRDITEKASEEPTKRLEMTERNLGSSLDPVPWDTTATSAVRKLSFSEQQHRFETKRERILKKAYLECKRITASYAKTFFLGTSLLSEEKRLPVWAIYVWCRRTDDIVDGPRAAGNDDEVREVLADWEKRIDEIFAGRAFDALDLALVDVVQKFPLLRSQPFFDMVEGMKMDLQKSRYETWQELYLYCYRVAATVGLMTLPIMGTATPGKAALEEAKEPAIALGIALQITNILRDVGEDAGRGRIYIPKEDMEKFNYTEEELFNGVINENYIDLMKFEIARARDYFQQAEAGIAMLAPDARLPVRASMDIYGGILTQLEANRYDNFTKRAYVTKAKKISMLPLSWMRTVEDGPGAALYNLLGRP